TFDQTRAVDAHNAYEVCYRWLAEKSQCGITCSSFIRRRDGGLEIDDDGIATHRAGSGEAFRSGTRRQNEAPRRAESVATRAHRNFEPPFLRFRALTILLLASRYVRLVALRRISE